MFGNNEPLPRHKSDGTFLQVQEIFRTIQGEGPDAGTPATFIRLWGCHLHCWFCDTDFMSNQQLHAISEIACFCRGGPRLVVLTGGEPMRQNVAPLVRQLIRYGHRCQIETAGSFDFHDEWWPNGSECSVVISPKTPAVDASLAMKALAYKYVISANLHASEADGLPVVNYQERGGAAHKLARPPWLASSPERIFVQPMDEQEPIANRANAARCAELALRFGYRVSLQTHKILGVP